MKLFLQHKCIACGFEYQLDRPLGLLDLARDNSKFFKEPTNWLETKCPSCGCVQEASERKFLGLKPKHFQLLAAIVIFILVAVSLYLPADG